jgi:tetratricopeptide (TPR) repeat protein
MSAEAERWKEKGNEEFKKGNMQQAIEYYTYATEMDPKNHIFFTNRAAAYAHMQKWEKSLRDAQKSIDLNPSWDKGHWRIGNAYMAMENYAEAEKAFKTASDLAPDNATYKELHKKAKKAALKGMSEAEILKKEGNEAYSLGDQEGAIKKYTSAIEACEAKEAALKADLLANRAACYRQLYNPKACVDDCTAALALVPGHVKALIRRAQSLENLEKYEDALRDFEQANILAPGTKVASEGAARIRAALKRNEKEKKGKK